MQSGVVFQRGSQPVENGRAPGPVLVGLRRVATRNFDTSGGPVDSPRSEGDLVSVDRVERRGQFALGGWHCSPSQRDLGESLAAEAQIRPLARYRPEPTQFLELFACMVEMSLCEPVPGEPQVKWHLENRANQC